MRNAWLEFTTYFAIASFFILSGNPVIAKIIDLKNSSDISGDYELGFCARPSPDTFKQLPGHVFVSYSHVPNKGQRTFFAIGHTVTPDSSPAAATWSYFGKPVEGYLKEEIYTSSMEQCLRVKVSKKDYDAAYALTVSPLQSLGVLSHKDLPVFQAYKLGEHDCMEFLIKVGSTLKSKGLKLPQRGATEFPIPYVIRLINDN